MHPSKAPGPDGIKCRLFKKNWDVVGKSIFVFVFNCFATGYFAPSVNQTIIAFCVKPGRGLRQGDPLLSYIFVLCMERLLNMINDKVSNGNCKGLKASQSGPIVYHFFFTDDILLFSKANMDNCRVVMDTLDEFCDISAQSINLNLHKSVMFISPNIARSRVNVLHFTTHTHITMNLDKYLLGVP